MKTANRLEFEAKTKFMREMRKTVLNKIKGLVSFDSNVAININNIESLKQKYLQHINDYHLTGMMVLNRMDYIKFQRLIISMKEEV